MPDKEERPRFVALPKEGDYDHSERMPEYLPWRVPGRVVKLPPRNQKVRLTDTTYDLGGYGHEVPAVLSYKDVEWELKNRRPSRMRERLEELGYKVEPSYGIFTY